MYVSIYESLKVLDIGGIGLDTWRQRSSEHLRLGCATTWFR